MTQGMSASITLQTKRIIDINRSELIPMGVLWVFRVRPWRRGPGKTTMGGIVVDHISLKYYFKIDQPKRIRTWSNPNVKNA